jgi:phosphoribosylanthranilate isomerase
MTPDPILKICGITQLTDALHAAREGATAIGFVFWPGSPRAISPERAGEIAAALPADVTTVGVFVNESLDGIRIAARKAGVRMVQLHGDEPPAYVDEIEQPVLRSVTLDTIVDTARAWPADTTWLLDSTDPVRGGGARAVIDWSRAQIVARDRRVVLAGGLTPENIEEAIMTVRPFGVDVSSGVESRPGVKDVDKVSRFLANARAAFTQR